MQTNYTYRKKVPISYGNFTFISGKTIEAINNKGGFKFSFSYTKPYLATYHAISTLKQYMNLGFSLYYLI